MCNHSCVARKDSSIIWSARSVLCQCIFEECEIAESSEIQFLVISIYLIFASHHLKQVRCLALEVIIFCLKIVACDVSVSFLNACYLGFGLYSIAHTKYVNLS